MFLMAKGRCKKKARMFEGGRKRRGQWILANKRNGREGVGMHPVDKRAQHGRRVLEEQQYRQGADAEIGDYNADRDC